MKKFFLFFTCILLLSCKQSLEGGNEIISFKFQEISQANEAYISNDTVLIMVPTNTDLTSLTPVIEVSVKATINPASGVKQDFSKPVFYTVTSELGTKKVT